ncbi:dihydropteroate synthase [Alteromonas sp. ASW11-130]|uniref:dihydropteroate synthase n=1 Tax=Alteromonas sp. ASW11-130 TaxID=3015775 RepID=UPI0022424498|nr:dihydropteroate synthase [Alteromonas sp. ASW11-130]MCW8092111.1 dihydropteroate synthase [Alteromonas sp. ASW11-130]
MKFKDKIIDLSRPQVMGILNVTPDSFSDGGQYNSLDAGIRHAQRMVADGATFIDVGGESTRPGAVPVSEEEELERVIPIVELLVKEVDCVVSVDTSKAAVMKEAADAGAGLINDVYALTKFNSMETVAKLDIPVCLMHMQGTPETMQIQPEYDDVINEVRHFFRQRVEDCIEAGIRKNRILLDPGFGFGKTLHHNYRMLKRLNDISFDALPLLVGMSNKSMLGTLLDRKVKDRLAGNISVATIAALNGANILRVHDVKQTCDAVKIVNYLSDIEK